MLANLKKIFVCAVLAGAGAMYLSFNWPSSNAPALDSPTVNNQGEYFFHFADGSLPASEDSSYTTTQNITIPAANDFDNWMVCATFDDGTFWMSDKYAFEHHGFPFSQPGGSGTRSCTVELAPVYDDGNTSPGRIIPFTFPPVSTSSTTQWTANAENQRRQTLTNGKHIVRLISSLDPKAGQGLTYVITYQNLETCTLNGELNFYFDGNVLSAAASDVVEFEPTKVPDAIVPVSFNKNGTIYTMQKLRMPFSLPVGAQRNVFIHCTTSSTVNTSSTYYTPWVDYSVPLNASCNGKEIVDRSEMPTQHIVDAYDPNHKMAVDPIICMDKDSVTFTITFQNDGTDTTKKVVVTDELHQFLKNVEPRLVSWSTKKKPIVSAPGADRLVTFTFDPLGLHGMHEAGLGTRFSVADTRADFTFRCAVAHDSVSTRPCNGILNQATIRFNCNPPISTDLAYAFVQCDSCDACQTQLDTIIIVDSVPITGHPLLGSDLTNMINALGFGNSITRYVWYPGVDLNKPTNLNPKFDQPKHFEYTLVASNSFGSTCQRCVVHLRFKNPCDLGIHIDPAGLQIDPCTGIINGTLVASATGSHSSNLHWNDCSVIDTTFSRILNNTRQVEYYFGVTDEDTGCTAELVYVVQVPACHPGGGGGVISWPVLSAIIAAILAFLWWLRNKLTHKRQNLPDTPSPM